jgi:hypothetical protein
MEMRKLSFRPAVVTLLLLVTMGVCAPYARGQQAPNTAPQRHELRAVRFNGDLASLLRQLAREYGVTIGLEVSPKQPKPQVNFDVRDATFNDVMDAIVRAQPTYQWREDNGAVDFYLTSGGSPVLDIMVGSFQVSEAGWAEASDALLGRPEVQSSMSAMGLSRREAERKPSGRSGEAFSLRLENVTVRRALHEMAKKSGSHFWVFRQYGDGGKFFSLDSSAH